MASPPKLPDQDYELLSAYLDDQLPARERAALESRLAAEPQLRAALDGLRVTIRVLRMAPKLILPRAFTLDAKSARLRRIPWWARTRVLEFTGALGAVASILIIVLGVVLGGAPGQQSSASAPIVMNVVANSNPTKVVAILPTPTETATELPTSPADKISAASAAEAATASSSASSSDLGGLAGAAPGAAAGFLSASGTAAVASSTLVPPTETISLQDQTGGAANSSFAANPTSAPAPLSAAPGAAGGNAPGSAAGGAPSSKTGSSINSAAIAPQPPIDSAAGIAQTSVSMLAFASPTLEPTTAPTTAPTVGQTAGQVIAQAGAPANSPAATASGAAPTATLTTAQQAQQLQAATPSLLPEQPKANRLVATPAPTIVQQALLVTATPAPAGAVEARRAQNSPEASQVVLIAGIVLLVLSAMLFGIGWMRSRL